jgi:hypothetical protein
MLHLPLNFKFPTALISESYIQFVFDFMLHICHYKFMECPYASAKMAYLHKFLKLN